MIRIAVILLCLVFQTSLAQTGPCERHPLFNMLPEHKISFCEEKEFDKIEMSYYDNQGTYIQIEKKGYLLTSWYAFQGAFEKRPSNALIFQNYIQAVTSKGGSIIHQNNSRVYLQVKSAGEQWWIIVQSDQSGTYSVNALKEVAMNQYIVLSAEDIEKEVKQLGKVAFYGIYFDTDKAEIKPESKETLEQMAKYLTQNPKIRAYIVGHTDNTGTFQHNMNLSQKRAEAVVEALNKIYKISLDRLTAHGVSSLSPIVNNSTDEGKAKNRRVELVIQ
jgi:outer membrane protein OmpA-like peptidoglycan-associated protein